MKALFRLVIFSTALGVLVACSSPAPSVTPTSTISATRRPRLAETRAAESAPTLAAAMSTAAPTVSPGSVDPLQAIANSVHSFGAITSYRMTVVIAGGPPSQNGTVKIEIAGNEYHFASTKGVEFYLIGDTFYLKENASSAWRKLPSNSAEATGVTSALLAPRKSLTSAIAAHNASLSGTDVLDGNPMLVYQYTLNNSPAKLWVGVADGLPYKMEGISNTGAQTTLTISDYNAPIVLTPPIP